MRDLREMYVAFAESCELGADPITWRLHLLDRIAKLLGPVEGQVGLCAELRINPWRGSTKRIGVVDMGWVEPQQRQRFLHGMDGWHATEHERFDRWAQTRVRVATHDRTTMFGQADDAYANAFYQNQFVRSGMCDMLLSRGYIALGRIHVMTLMRPAHVPPFTIAQRRLLHLLKMEVTSQLGKRLALMGEPSLEDLPTRLRQVLARLLQGDSEKQVAFHLNISHHTVHDYVKKLHGYFDVSSRGELLARCRGLTPVAERLRALTTS
jgi:DNA-binding NarL/FixJ family response regulator